MSKFDAVLCRAAHEERKRNAELQKQAQKRAEELKNIVSEYVDTGSNELDIDDTIDDDATFSTDDVAKILGVSIPTVQRLVRSGHVPTNVISSHVHGRTKFMFTPATVARMVERKNQGFYVGFPELSGDVDPPPGWIEVKKLAPLLKIGYAAVLRRCKIGEIEAKVFRVPNGNTWHLSPQGLQSLLDEFGA